MRPPVVSACTEAAATQIGILAPIKPQSAPKVFYDVCPNV